MGKRSLSRSSSSSEGAGVVTHLDWLRGVSKHSRKLAGYIGGLTEARKIFCRNRVLARGAKMGGPATFTCLRQTI